VVVFGSTGGARTELDVRHFYFGHLSLLGTTMGSPCDFEALLRLVAAGACATVLDSTWSLADAVGAQDRLASADHFGKIILRPT
jgi:zinc-binding alcohol dehydrogenase/oxidoreductase